MQFSPLAIASLLLLACNSLASPMLGDNTIIPPEEQASASPAPGDKAIIPPEELGCNQAIVQALELVSRESTDVFQKSNANLCLTYCREGLDFNALTDIGSSKQKVQAFIKEIANSKIIKTRPDYGNSYSQTYNKNYEQSCKEPMGVKIYCTPEDVEALQLQLPFDEFAEMKNPKIEEIKIALKDCETGYSQFPSETLEQAMARIIRAARAKTT